MKLCKIGIHHWDEVPVAQFEMMYSKAVVYGDVCIHCGKHRESFESEVHGLPHPDKWKPYTKEVIYEPRRQVYRNRTTRRQGVRAG